MTEQKWQDFASLLNECNHELNNPDCPFKQLRTMDQYEKLEFMRSIHESEAAKMMNNCLCFQNECYPTSDEKEGLGWGMAAAI